MLALVFFDEGVESLGRNLEHVFLEIEEGGKVGPLAWLVPDGGLAEAANYLLSISLSLQVSNILGYFFKTLLRRQLEFKKPFISKRRVIFHFFSKLENQVGLLFDGPLHCLTLAGDRINIVFDVAHASVEFLLGVYQSLLLGG